MSGFGYERKYGLPTSTLAIPLRAEAEAPVAGHVYLG
jgi:hypothetical protein